MIQGLEPIINKDSKILILGSMPGAESLRKSEYYGYKHNHFWEIIFSLFKETPKDSYLEKKEFVLEKKIAIWDVIKNCEREGSLDSNIRNYEHNNFKCLFKEYPSIEKIFFNGKAAENLFRKAVLKDLEDFNKKLISLPSTSPANTIGIEKKLIKWKQIIIN